MSDVLDFESIRISAARGPGERLDCVVADLPVAVYESQAGPSGRCLFASDGIFNLLGFTPTEWTSEKELWRRSVHRDDRPVAGARETGLAAPGIVGKVHVAEYRMIHRDRSQVWVRDEARLTRARDGLVWRGTLTDVTRDRRSRQILGEAVERYRDLARQSPADAARRTDELPDAYRLHCRTCAVTWAGDEATGCWACGSPLVDAISVNGTMAELERAELRVQELLGGIEKHLEHLAQGRGGRGTGRFSEPHPASPD